MAIVTIVNPRYDLSLSDYPSLSWLGFIRVESVNVARVQPKASKGITDLLLSPASRGFLPHVRLRSSGVVRRSSFPRCFYTLASYQSQATPPTI
jgi:hypothetical protein